MRNQPGWTRLLLGLTILVFGAGRGRAADEVRVLSPDRSVEIKVVPRDGRLHYAVAFKGRPVLEPSPLSVTLDGVDITRGVAPGGEERYVVKESYPWRGVHARAVNHCHGARITLKHAPSNTAYTLDVRAFNDGVAFRHVIPDGGSPRVPDEATKFVVPPGSTVWLHDLGGHYEAVHQKKAIADVQAGEWAAPPLTVRLPGDAGYAALVEAALVNYAGAALQADGRRGFGVVLGHKHPIAYPFKLRFAEDVERVGRPAAVAGPITSPWRVVMVGADLNALVNSDLIPNLCPPPDPALFPKGLETDWVRPGRAVWKYLDGGESTPDGVREFCRLAGELGFEYSVLEGYWQRWDDAQLRELVAHGKQHGVRLWLWKRSKELREPEARRAFFKRCQDLGVAGVKLDFFDHEAKEVVDFYQVLLREAAEHRLMVNFHGSNKPTGEPRTWPNELIREAVRGLEAGKLHQRARHNATLPFTRFLAGHADYTPVHFGARRGDTTWAHQIATAAVFTEPLLTYGAHPRALLANPGVAMIKAIPAVWDETCVLPASEIGEVAAFARRRGDVWFLAVLNGPTPRTLRVPLTFLGEGRYQALTVRDRPDEAAAVRVETVEASRKGTVQIDLQSGGGFVGRYVGAPQ